MISSVIRDAIADLEWSLKMAEMQKEIAENYAASNNLDVRFSQDYKDSVEVIAKLRKALGALE